MSEFINNRSQKQAALKDIIKKLHEGATVDQVKADFDLLTTGVSALEITEMEQALVDEGMKVEDIQKLCDVHASVFKGSIEAFQSEETKARATFEEGHPVHTFKLENRKIEALIDDELIPLLKLKTLEMEAIEKLRVGLEKLFQIDIHYRRKENLLFPFMEKYEITAPPQVMWGVDDEIRAELKRLKAFVNSNSEISETIIEALLTLFEKIKEMIFKEEEIMFPMVIEKYSIEEWAEIERASKEIGFAFLNTVKRWLPAEAKTSLVNIDLGSGQNVFSAEANVMTQTGPSPQNRVKAEDPDIIVNRIQRDSKTIIPFDAGSLSSEEVNAILNTIPFDMTFVGADNKVKYFTQGQERIFDRPITIIGREVKHCHPPKSVHIVEQIVDDLRTGRKNHEDFWIKMGEQFVYIRYFAVRNKSGEFLGTLEITQNIKPITELEGEKRLMS